MRHMVARRVKFGTALVHSSYGTTASSGLVGRAPAMPEKRIPIKIQIERNSRLTACTLEKRL